MSPDDAVHGEDGELIERLILLVEQPLPAEPGGWSRRVARVGNLVGVKSTAFPQASDRRDLVQRVTERLNDVCQQVDEALLVRALRNHLDGETRASGDLAKFEKSRGRYKDEAQLLLTDPAARDEYRAGEIECGMRPSSDEKIIEGAESSLRSSRPLDVDQASRRWVQADEWELASCAWLSDRLIEQWSKKRLLRLAETIWERYRQEVAAIEREHQQKLAEINREFGPPPPSERHGEDEQPAS